MRDIGVAEATTSRWKRLFTQGMVTKQRRENVEELGNVVSPDDMVASVWGGCSKAVFVVCGAAGSRSGLAGRWRFRHSAILGRLYRFVTRHAERKGSASGSQERSEADRAALRKLHQTIGKITNDFDSRWHFNTSIASLMEL